MRVVIFCHSLLSDWNHGNAHFLRGICSELLARGFELRVYEPETSWSLKNLIAAHGEGPVRRFREAYPQLESIRYRLDRLDLNEALEGADLVLVHEWNEPELVKRIGRHRVRTGRYSLLFHDTHHRSVTDPDSMARYDLEHYDGVLAFGDSVSEVYRLHGWGHRVWTWHEAADTRVFRPVVDAQKQGDLVWIGNWGDEERSAELHQFLLQPVRDLGLKARVHGVRYPAEAMKALADAGIDYAGWSPNFEAPQIFSRFRFTVHVPRRPYATALPGVPTIRVFEALACGIPLLSAPWEDRENLFTPGEDFLFALDGNRMRAHLRTLLNDPAAAQAIAHHGRKTVERRHTCAHRVDELLSIQQQLKSNSCVAAGGLSA
jgi:spore maturation protein CgeB